MQLHSQMNTYRPKLTFTEKVHEMQMSVTLFSLTDSLDRWWLEASRCIDNISAMDRYTLIQKPIKILWKVTICSFLIQRNKNPCQTPVAASVIHTAMFTHDWMFWLIYWKPDSQLRQAMKGERTNISFS